MLLQASRPCALENRYDAAIVSVPDHRHFDYTGVLLRQGIHCLVVKPLTPTLAEALELERIPSLRALWRRGISQTLGCYQPLDS